MSSPLLDMLHNEMRRSPDTDKNSLNFESAAVMSALRALEAKVNQIEFERDSLQHECEELRKKLKRSEDELEYIAASESRKQDDEVKRSKRAMQDKLQERDILASRLKSSKDRIDVLNDECRSVELNAKPDYDDYDHVCDDIDQLQLDLDALHQKETILSTAPDDDDDDEVEYYKRRRVESTKTVSHLEAIIHALSFINQST